MPSRIDEAGHTKALVTQSRSTGGEAEMFSSAGGTRTDNTSARSRTWVYGVGQCQSDDSTWMAAE